MKARARIRLVGRFEVLNVRERNEIEVGPGEADRAVNVLAEGREIRAKRGLRPRFADIDYHAAIPFFAEVIQSAEPNADTAVIVGEGAL